MAYPVITHETELDDLVGELLELIPSYEDDSEEDSSDDSPVGPLPQASEGPSSPNEFDQAQLDTDFHYAICISEGNTYAHSHEDAFHDFEQSWNEVQETEARFEDAYNLLHDHDSFQDDSEDEQSHDIITLADVTYPSEEGCNEVSANEPPLDLNNLCNADTISQIEGDVETDVVFEFGDIIHYLYYITTENSSMDTK